MSALVEIRRLSKIYPRGKQRIEVLHQVDLDIQGGDFLALMGPCRVATVVDATQHRATQA